jgi:glutamyl-Q tRNA(Asp) synthetase
VVRGEDLLQCSARQIHLRNLLELPSPRYAHIALITDASGRKLSKSDADDPLLHGDHAEAMRLTLQHLQHAPPASINTVEGMLAWAIQHWQPARLSSTWS